MGEGQEAGFQARAPPLPPHCSPSPSAGGCGSVWKHRKEALWASGKSPHLSGPVFSDYGVGLIPAGHRKDCGVISPGSMNE